MSNLVRRTPTPAAPPDRILNAQVAEAERVGIAAVARIQAGAFATSVAMQNACMLSRAANAAFKVSPMPFFAYIDEPKVLGDLPVPLDSLFELARGLGVGLTIGAQSLTQLPRVVSQAALTNAATIIAFKQAADDAQLLARELVGLTGEELQGLGRFEVAARLGLGPGDVAPVATGVTLPLAEPTSDPQTVRMASAERFGRSLEAVDQALQARHRLPNRPATPPTSAGAVGRLRRSSS